MNLNYILQYSRSPGSCWIFLHFTLFHEYFRYCNMSRKIQLLPVSNLWALWHIYYYLDPSWPFKLFELIAFTVHLPCELFIKCFLSLKGLGATRWNVYSLFTVYCAKKQTIIDIFFLGIYNTDELFIKEPRRRRAQQRPVHSCPTMTLACTEQQVSFLIFSKFHYLYLSILLNYCYIYLF